FGVFCYNNRMIKNRIVSLVALALTLMVSSNLNADDRSWIQDSTIILQAAKEEIQFSKDSGSTVTACSIYVGNVLDRAGFSVGSFVSNNFHNSMAAHLPHWQSAQFTTDNPGEDQEALRNFLNAAPDHSVFLAQWSRVGQGGHVAIVEKVSADNYLIYQSQSNLTLPHSKPAKVRNLLYPKGEWGDRSHLRLFFE
ncbi:MAG: hypothetical protein V4736_02100, partial [Bdellovibrionota bacterium]